MAYLVLVRHGSTEYNEKGLWTGHDNPPLSTQGKDESKKTAKNVSGIEFDIAFSSPLIRCKETLEAILNALDLQPKTTYDNALSERDYGDYTGQNKWEVKKKLGDEEFMRLRRGWDYPIPNGESLKDVYNRIVPYFQTHILPSLKDEKNILLVSSGNALRAMVKYLEHINDDDITNFEIATGQSLVYKIGNEGEVLTKEIRSIGSIVP